MVYSGTEMKLNWNQILDNSGSASHFTILSVGQFQFFTLMPCLVRENGESFGFSNIIGTHVRGGREGVQLRN